MERLLCIKIASRGDLLLAGPAFRSLRERHHGASITLFVGGSCVDVARHLPYFDEIQIIDDQALMGAGWPARLQETWRFFRRLRRWLRSGAPDRMQAGGTVLIFHRDWRYAFLTWLARIPIRKGLGGRLARIFLTHPYHVAPREHHVRQYHAMALPENTDPLLSNGDPLKGVWRFAEGEKEAALRQAASHGFDPQDGQWVALGFGGGRNVKTHTRLKTWPVDHYRRLALELSARGCLPVWVGDAEDARLLGDAPAGVNLAGRLTVPETAAVLSVCQRVVANDSLILHLAEAVGVATIGLFGPTDPEHYRPLARHSSHVWGGQSLPCSPCHRDGWFPACRFEHRCMTELSVEMVIEKLEMKP